MFPVQALPPSIGAPAGAPACLQAAEIGGIRAILVHAISESAKRFYERHGFITSPVDQLTVMITLAEAVKSLEDQSG